MIFRYIMQVVPVLIQNLPLKEDMEENDTVYGCILQLLDNCHPAIMACLVSLLQVLSVELSPMSALNPDVKSKLITALKKFSMQCPQQLQNACSQLSEEQLSILRTVVQ
ncbi:hypothetical protein EMCRGX_G030826 [Ephydatia muelleri]